MTSSCGRGRILAPVLCSRLCGYCYTSGVCRIHIDLGCAGRTFGAGCPRTGAFPVSLLPLTMCQHERAFYVHHRSARRDEGPPSLPSPGGPSFSSGVSGCVKPPANRSMLCEGDAPALHVCCPTLYVKVALHAFFTAMIDCGHETGLRPCLEG